MPTDVYEVVDGKLNANRIENCIECGLCEGVCPTEAILRHCSW